MESLTSTNTERNDLCAQELQVIHEIIQVHADILKFKYRSSRIVDTKTIFQNLYGKLKAIPKYDILKLSISVV